MTQFLTFSLVAPLASHGGVAVGTRRPSDDRPARSAIMGLVAAALGVDREDEQRHADLEAGLLYAVRVEDLGRRPRPLLADYHTTQTAPTRRGVTYHTRRDEVLAQARTILSHREYVQDSAYTVALWMREVERRSALTCEHLAAALRCPVYVLYAGRKACPLAAPMNPVVVEAASVRQAFEARDRATEPERQFRERRRMVGVPRYMAMDADAGELGTRRERRRDSIVSRGRWQFGAREEVTCPW